MVDVKCRCFLTGRYASIIDTRAPLATWPIKEQTWQWMDNMGGMIEQKGVLFDWSFLQKKIENIISGTGEGRNDLWGETESRMRGMYRNTEQDNIPLNEVASIYPTQLTQLTISILFFIKGASMECQRKDWDQRRGSKKEKVLLRDPLLVGQVSSSLWQSWEIKFSSDCFSFLPVLPVLPHKDQYKVKFVVSLSFFFFVRNLNSGLRFLVTLVLILALAFATAFAFIVFCRKCDDEVCVLF